MEQKITAGRDELGGFAPKFAQLNDDVLFGEVWAREEALSARDRSIVTVTGPDGRRHSGQFSENFTLPTPNATASPPERWRKYSPTPPFYAGWPKAWAALRMAKEVYEG